MHLNHGSVDVVSTFLLYDRFTFTIVSLHRSITVANSRYHCELPSMGYTTFSFPPTDGYIDMDVGFALTFCNAHLLTDESQTQFFLLNLERYCLFSYTFVIRQSMRIKNKHTHPSVLPVVIYVILYSISRRKIFFPKCLLSTCKSKRCNVFFSAELVTHERILGQVF